MKKRKTHSTPMSAIESLESQVRSYCRSFPTTFSCASGYKMWDTDGREYIDFFAGAGALNYGHNNPRMQESLVEYILSNGITHGLDMATEAKEAFLKKFDNIILKPRGLQYKIMFPGPTGTNSVESALKIARKATGRDTVISFTNAFHGMTLGSLSVTGNAFKREGAGLAVPGTNAMPFDGYLGDDVDTADYLHRFLEDPSSGISTPAAVILETLQGEGGLNTASFKWLQKIEQICRQWDIVLIVDDIQAGCGRTGPFFSFEPSGIKPDIVCLSKSISGYGFPLALTLISPELDVFEPGEHNGTFRGNNPAFITAAKSLDYWKDGTFRSETVMKGNNIRRALKQIVRKHPLIQGEVRGRGMMQGIAFGVDGMAEKVCSKAFKRGLIIETSGPNDEVIKVMPPLIIDEVGLENGLLILEESIKAVQKEIA